MSTPHKFKTPILSSEMIEAQASIDLQTYVRNTGRPLVFPIFADEVLKSVWGVDVEYRDQIADPKGQQVLACFVPAEKTVLFNSSMRTNEGRASYTLAHEAGHVSLHSYLHGSNVLCTDTEYRRARYEHEADKYASYLLMPRDAVFSALREFGLTATMGVDLRVHGEKLRDYFGVSHQALEIRLAAVGVKLIRARYAQQVVRQVSDRYFDQKEEERISWSFKGP